MKTPKRKERPYDQATKKGADGRDRRANERDLPRGALRVGVAWRAVEAAHHGKTLGTMHRRARDPRLP